jgi:hypothetical protein
MQKKRFKTILVKDMWSLSVLFGIIWWIWLCLWIGVARNLCKDELIEKHTLTRPEEFGANFVGTLGTAAWLESGDRGWLRWT